MISASGRQWRSWRMVEITRDVPVEVTRIVEATREVVVEVPRELPATVLGPMGVK